MSGKYLTYRSPTRYIWNMSRMRPLPSGVLESKSLLDQLNLSLVCRAYSRNLVGQSAGNILIRPNLFHEVLGADMLQQSSKQHDIRIGLLSQLCGCH
jgi:hypothetical protein